MNFEIEVLNILENKAYELSELRGSTAYENFLTES